MADFVIDWLQPSGVGSVNSVAHDQTGPVGQSERGRTPQIAAGLPFEPPYQPSPGAGGVGGTSPGFIDAGAVGNETIYDATGTPVAPAAPRVVSDQGFICVGWEDALYGRIHLIPASIELGNVLQEQAVNVEVWNAFETGKTLDSIAGINASGINVVSPTPPGAPPAAYPPLSSYIYQVQVLTTGPSNIAAQFVFDFTVEAPVLRLTGTRVITLPFMPQRPLTEALEWRTDILESFDGNEQRIRARNLPRQLFEMRYLESSDRARSALLNRILGHQGSPFAIPVWHFGRPLLQDASIGQSTIFLDTTFADFRPSTADEQSLLILWRSSTDFEVVQIAEAGVSDTQIDLERNLEQNHSAGITEVVPVQVMISQDPVEWDLTPNGVLTLNAKWLAFETTDLAADDGDLTIYRGLPVLTGFNFVNDGLSESYADKYELFDNATGEFRALRRRTIGEYRSNKGFETDTAEDAWTLRQLIYALRGQQRTFWMPTWRNDFEVLDTIGPSDLDITVSEAAHSRFIAGTEPFSSLMVLLRDGTQFFRQITGASEGAPGEETISIDNSLGQAVNPGDIQLVSFLYRARLGSDRVAFTHRHKGVVSVRTPIIGVKQ